MASTDDPKSDIDATRRLRLLWKGTLYVAIVGLYLTIVVLVFIHFGWRPALLTLFLVALPQCFRYIASDVDRIGWRMTRTDSDTAADTTRVLQKRLLWLQVGLIQTLNLLLILHIAFLAGINHSIATGAVLLAVEIMFSRIRATNRQVAFEQARYGLDDAGLFRTGSSNRAREDRTEQLERKLAKLEEMADEGLISQRAYEKARDKHRVLAVIEAD